MIGSIRSSLVSSSRSAFSAALRQPLASTSRCGISTSSTSTAPAPAARPARKAPAARSGAGAQELLSMFDDLNIPDNSQDAAVDDGSLLSSIGPNQAISPGSLAPERLLEPFPARSDFTRAHPLGPPTAAALSHDPFIRLGISPLASPMNVHLRTDFCSSMGKIQPRGKTSLQRSSQRKMAKAVRRARSMGIVATFAKNVPT